jgi:hypothetical protein
VLREQGREGSPGSFGDDEDVVAVLLLYDFVGGDAPQVVAALGLARRDHRGVATSVEVSPPFRLSNASRLEPLKWWEV